MCQDLNFASCLAVVIKMTKLPLNSLDSNHPVWRFCVSSRLSLGLAGLWLLLAALGSLISQDYLSGQGAHTYLSSLIVTLHFDNLYRSPAFLGLSALLAFQLLLSTFSSCPRNRSDFALKLGSLASVLIIAGQLVNSDPRLSPQGCLTLHSGQTVYLGSQPLVSASPSSHGISLSLQDFHLEKNQDNLVQYVSTLVLSGSGQQCQARLAVNQPVSFLGWRLYQTGCNLNSFTLKRQDHHSGTAEFVEVPTTAQGLGSELPYISTPQSPQILLIHKFYANTAVANGRVVPLPGPALNPAALVLENPNPSKNKAAFKTLGWLTLAEPLTTSDASKLSLANLNYTSVITYSHPYLPWLLPTGLALITLATLLAVNFEQPKAPFPQAQMIQSGDAEPDLGTEPRPVDELEPTHEPPG